MSRGLCSWVELPLSNRHLGVCKPPPVAALRCRRPAHPLVLVSAMWLDLVDLTSPHKPPSRGMRASSSRCAPMSSARTPTRVGFHVIVVDKLSAQNYPGGLPHAWACQQFARSGLFRSPAGGCVARQHRSAATGGGRRARQRGGFSTKSAGSPARHFWRTSAFFPAPMVGAPPDNIGAQRGAEGGVPASGAGTATVR